MFAVGGKALADWSGVDAQTERPYSSGLGIRKWVLGRWLIMYRAEVV